MHRYRHKASELGIATSSFREKVRRFNEDGLCGLVDKRTTRSARGRKVDERVVEVLRQVINEYTGKSNPSAKTLRLVVARRVKEQYADEVPFPSRSTFERLLDEMPGSRALFGSAKTRRSAANRPPTPYEGVRPTRAGELVEIDITRLDVHAMDHITGDWLRVELLAAIDVRTAIVPAVRLVPYSSRASDAMLLLHDILTPRGVSVDGHAVALPYCGVPERIILGNGLVVSDELPGLYPEAVVVDGGGPFKSEFRDACRRVGISVRLARPATPTDKPHIERFFRTLRHDLLELLPGYKGPDLYARGAAIEADAFYFVDELESLIREFIATIYHHRSHAGLHLAECPGVRLTPYEAYTEAISRTGYVRVPGDATLHYQLLPTQWREIQHYGVDVFSLEYDGAVLDPYRKQRSRHSNGKSPFYVDPRDLTRIYFRDPADDSWHELYWKAALRDPQPFSESTLEQAKRMLVLRGGNKNNKDEVAYAVNDLLERHTAAMDPSTILEKKALIREGVYRKQLARERGGPRALDDELVERATGAAQRARSRSAANEVRDVEPLPNVGDDADSPTVE
jgi:transposase InsO family protein